MKPRFVVAWLGLAALLVLHLDFWRGERSGLWLDAVPEELVYRIAWMGLAFLYLLFFTHFIWRDES